MQEIDIKMQKVLEKYKEGTPEAKNAHYIRDHIYHVVEKYEWLKINLPQLVEGYTDINMWEHDASKWEEPEWTGYMHYFYNSDNSDWDKAYEHHIKHNSHHWNHWVLNRKDIGKPNFVPICVDMPYRCVVELICDWWSFSPKENPYEIFHFWETHKDKMYFSPNTKKTILKFLNEIKRKLGENCESI